MPSLLCLSFSPSSFQFLSLLLGLLISFLSYEKAEQDCTRALAIEPTHLKSLYRRAMAYRLAGNYTSALEGKIETIEISSHLFPVSSILCTSCESTNP